MRYEWDERKNQSNQRKHGGISFELAVLVFEDERCLIELDRVDEIGGAALACSRCRSYSTWHGSGFARSSCIQGEL